MGVSPPAPGFLFYPTDEEILNTFLKKKLQDLPLPSDTIKEADVYGTHPGNLTAQFERSNRFSQWFFFTWTTRKHPDATSSTRASRVAGQGRWKSTQSVKLVRDGKGQVVGSKQNFSYMEHRAAGKEEKTMWLMEEYSLRTKGGGAVSKDRKKLDDWVVCKVYLRPNARKETPQPLIYPSEMVPFQAPYGALQQHLAPQNMDGSFESLCDEQPASISNESLDHAPQHDGASLHEILHPVYHEQSVDAPNKDRDYGPVSIEQFDWDSLPEIFPPLDLSSSFFDEIFQ